MLPQNVPSIRRTRSGVFVNKAVVLLVLDGVLNLHAAVAQGFGHLVALGLLPNKQSLAQHLALAKAGALRLRKKSFTG